jgi:TetR/AcrR family transcriptional regulator, ethionamide resistance regulator
MSAPVPARRRPRHDPADSEREILQAAEELIRERPFREVTVQRIMLRTGLKRPAFYVHFRDLGDVLWRVAERIGDEIEQASQKWLAGPSGAEEDLLEALESGIAVYLEHGALLRALADAAPTDERAEAAYFGVVEGLAGVVATRIAAEQELGRIPATLDAQQTARALVWMNERFLYQTVSGEASLDARGVTATLGRIWLATLYGAASAPASPGRRGA